MDSSFVWQSYFRVHLGLNHTCAFSISCNFCPCRVRDVVVMAKKCEALRVADNDVVV